MENLTFFVLLVLVLMVIFVAVAYTKRHEVSKSMTILLFGICCSSTVLFCPYFSSELSSLDGQGISVARTLALSIRSGLKAVSGSQDIDPVEDFIFSPSEDLSLLDPSGMEKLYLGLHYLFVVAGPLLTSGLIISLFGDIADRFRYFLSFSKKCHIFSALNETSVNLAKKIHEISPKDMIVFCDTADRNEWLFAEAKRTHAVFLYTSCNALRLPMWKKSLDFYLISPDEDKNLRLAEELISSHRTQSRMQIVINAFAESRTGIQVVESMDKGRIGMRFIDATSLMCSHLLLQEPLYNIAVGAKDISLMIVGCGKTGMRMLKTAIWCGQSEKRGLKLRVYDKKAAALEKELRTQCPELCDSYDISFVECDTGTADFENAVLDSQLGSADATYIFVSTGEDEQNIDTAERLFSLFRRHNRYGATPKILVRVRSAMKMDVYSGRENSYLQTRNIRFFSDLSEIFSHSMPFHSQLERLAFAVELCYNELLPETYPMDMSQKELKEFFSDEKVVECRNGFMHSEYRRRSSMAAALHIPTKLYDCGIIAVGENFLSYDVALRFRKALEDDYSLAEKLAYTEHSRWNAYMRSEGYRHASWEDLLCFYPQLETKNNQDQLSRTHLCITDWNELDELNKKYMALEPRPQKKDFKKSDRNIVQSIPMIIMLARTLEETGLDLSMYS